MVRVWGRWALRHGLDFDKLLPTIHGVRAIDTVRRLKLPGVDPAAEAAIIERDEIADVEGVAPIAGAIEFLAALPPERWTIVTSARTPLALARLGAAGIPVPPALVVGEDVASGKPAPDCYLLGAKRLGFAAADCLVFEDASAGVEAAMAAGAEVVVIASAQARQTRAQRPLHGRLAVGDYRDLELTLDGDRLRVRARSAGAGEEPANETARRTW